jgi:DNA-binding LytR/AlgR family response regulator
MKFIEVYTKQNDTLVYVNIDHIISIIVDKHNVKLVLISNEVLEIEETIHELKEIINVYKNLI